MKIKDMTFAITDKCTASCEICCFSCNPNKNHLLDKEIIKNYIAQLAENNENAQVGFTGGEALIYYDMVVECMEYARKQNLNSTLVTNCSFGKNFHAARDILQNLKSAGLVSMSVSADSYHQKFVPIQSVKNVILAALEEGIKVNIRLMELNDDDSIDTTLDLLRPEIYGTKLIVYPIFPTGDALKNIPREKFITTCTPEESFCPSVRTISAMFNGDLLMCCSQFAYDTAVAKIGKFGETSLNEAIKNITDNDFIYVMYMNGLGWYAKLAQKLGFEVEEEYCVSCQLCHELFSNAGFVKRAAPYVEEESNRIHLQKLFSARGN